MGFIDNLRAKYEIHRLEQRYARRDKRSTFVSGAQYVDGEYVYTASSPAPSAKSSSGGWSGKGGLSSVKVTEVFGGKRQSKAF